MNFCYSTLYQRDIETALSGVVGLERLKGASILVTGATGLIGSFAVDALLFYNQKQSAGIRLYAVGRSRKRLQERFHAVKTDALVYVEHNVNDTPPFAFHVDYILHAASNAYPAVFHADPVGTILSNILGTYQLLEYGRQQGAKRLLLVSSGEVYGQGDGSLDSFSESYSGYTDPVRPRSCYPNGKRTAETLCVSYTKQFGLDTVIARPCHTYGPNSTKTDNRAHVQFLNSARRKENIVLKSAGDQMRSYCYVADSVSAILTVLAQGKSCEAYNIANADSTATIAEFAREVAVQSGLEVIFAEPDEAAFAQRTPISRQVLDSRKLGGLGWRGQYSLADGIASTLHILKEQ